MSRSRHTEAQIIAALKQVEAGRMTEDVAREQGVSKHIIYAWKAKYGGMESCFHLKSEGGWPSQANNTRQKDAVSRSSASLR
jgi:transposase